MFSDLFSNSKFGDLARRVDSYVDIIPDRVSGGHLGGIGGRGGVFDSTDEDSSLIWKDVMAYNNAAAAEAAREQREFELSSSREVMDFNAAQAALDRNFQQSSANIANAFSASEAQKNRDWYDLQRSTSYQTAVQDLRAAGLNPALAYAQGGAASSSGAISAGVSASGSSASGIKASGSMAITDITTARDLLTTAATNATNMANTKTSAGAVIAAAQMKLAGDVLTSALSNGTRLALGH